MAVSSFGGQTHLAVVERQIAFRFWVAERFHVVTFATMCVTPASVLCFAVTFFAFDFCKIHAGVVVCLA